MSKWYSVTCPNCKAVNCCWETEYNGEPIIFNACYHCGTILKENGEVSKTT